MASVWIRRRQTAAGKPRYHVLYHLGGARARMRYAGSFRTIREATIRRQWVAGELAAMRVPDLTLLAAPVASATLAEAAQRWQASRVDAAEATKLQHRTALRKALPVLGHRPIDEVEAQEIADLVATLNGEGAARESIRKVVNALAMVFDHAGTKPNPARDKIIIRLPREERDELSPPTAEHVAAVYRVLPKRHRLAFLWLDWSGARVGSVDGLRVRDYDESRRSIRIPTSIMKTRRPVMVELAPELANALSESLGPREDRDLAARLFPSSGAAAMRTSIARACQALGVPPFSPHDLRHRRVSLLHLRGVPWAKIGELVGQRDLAVTANTYTHVLLDEGEVDYTNLLADAR